MYPSISTGSGIEINPVTSINELLSGTSFQEDEVAQEHLQSLGAAFHEISKTAEGQVLLVSMEGLAHRIKVNEDNQPTRVYHLLLSVRGRVQRRGKSLFSPL